MKFGVLTPIQNPRYMEELYPAPRNFLQRAAERFERWLGKQPYRMLNLLNIKCEVAPPKVIRTINDQERAVLAKLSRTKVNIFDTMLELVRVARDPEAKRVASFKDPKVDDSEAWRLLRNLRKHGAMIAALDEQITIRQRQSRTPKQQKLLNELIHLQGYQKALAKELMMSTAYLKKNFTMHVDKQEAAAIAKVLDAAWTRASSSDDDDPLEIVEQEFIRTKKNLPTVDVRAWFARDLDFVRETFERHGTIVEDRLRALLTHALREPDAYGAVYDFESAVGYLMGEKSKVRKAQMLDRLLQALSARLSGTGTADDVIEALHDMAPRPAELLLDLTVGSFLHVRTMVEDIGDHTPATLEAHIREKLDALSHGEISDVVGVVFDSNPWIAEYFDEVSGLTDDLKLFDRVLKGYANEARKRVLQHAPNRPIDPGARRRFEAIMEDSGLQIVPSLYCFFGIERPLGRKAGRADHVSLWGTE